MANLSKFHVVFSSSTLIRLDKDAFEGHLCQTVNNFVKQNKSSRLSPLRKRRPPQHIKHIRNTRVLGNNYRNGIRIYIFSRCYGRFFHKQMIMLKLFYFLYKSFILNNQSTDGVVLKTKLQHQLYT